MKQRRLLPGIPRPNEYPKPGTSESIRHKSYRQNRRGFRALRKDLRLQNITTNTSHSTMVRHVVSQAVYRLQLIHHPHMKKLQCCKQRKEYTHKPRAANTTVRHSKGKDGDNNTTGLPWWPKVASTAPRSLLGCYTPLGGRRNNLTGRCSLVLQGWEYMIFGTRDSHPRHGYGPSASVRLFPSRNANRLSEHEHKIYNVPSAPLGEHAPL